MGKKITAQAIGGETQTFEDVNSVGDLKAEMALDNYVATVNGNPAKDSDSLPDYAFVSLSAPVKGGKI